MVAVFAPDHTPTTPPCQSSTPIDSPTAVPTFARRLAAALGVALTPLERQAFPDGERYLRFPITVRLELVGKTVVLVGATDSLASLDELYRLACAAVKYG